ANDFFFQAEDGIRDKLVTGVQTCAFRSRAVAVGDAILFASAEIDERTEERRVEPAIRIVLARGSDGERQKIRDAEDDRAAHDEEIGRATCRERGRTKRGSMTGKRWWSGI